MRIQNNGPLIVATDYWETPHAARGLCYLSVNAGCFRFLLVPPMAGEIIAAAQTATMAIISRGPYQGRDCIELLLEDGSDTPYALHLDARQADRLWSPREDGRRVDVGLWVQGDGPTAVRLAVSMAGLGRLRTVDRLPCLEPWGT